MKVGEGVVDARYSSRIELKGMVVLKVDVLKVEVVDGKEVVVCGIIILAVSLFKLTA